MSIKEAGLSPTMPGNMRQTHFSGAIPALHVCPCGCARAFAPTRPWHQFYSPECRKKKWIEDRAGRTPSDIRATLNRIEIKLDQAIEAKLGIHRPAGGARIAGAK